MNLGTALLDLEVPPHRPGFFDELRSALGERGARTVRPRLLMVAAAAAVVAAALAFGLTRGSDVAAAAQVRAAVEHALASTGSISGVLVDNESSTPGAPGRRVRFVLSSTGAFRLNDLELGANVVYDPTRNTETSSVGHSDFERQIGLPSGPPDGNPAFLFTDQLGLGSVVAALANAHDPTVENITYDGRPAWLLRAQIGGGETAVTVDRATGIPVRNQAFDHGKLAGEVRIERLRVSATVPRIHLPTPHHGQHVLVYDAGFRRMSLAEARHAAGYSPLVPKRLPRGFTLSGIAFAAKSRPDSSVATIGNPPSRDVISLTYRRGLDEIIVTTRRTGPDRSAWNDPILASGVTTTRPSHVTFTGGALAGGVGDLLIAPGVFPHVSAIGPKLVVTIAGMVDRADLLKIANSLRVAG